MAYCKKKPPQMFEFKKVSGDKITTSELILKEIAWSKLDGAGVLDVGAEERVNITDGTLPMPKKCWIFELSSSIQVVLIGPVGTNTYPYFESLNVHLKPSMTVEHKVRGRLYTTIFPAFDKLSAEKTAADMKPKDVIVKAKNWSCKLASLPYLDDKNVVQVLLVADFNNDELPDFVVENAIKGTTYELLLSDSKSNDCKKSRVHQVDPLD